METKTFTDVRIKDAAQGIVEAVIATYGVVDKDGDVMVKGSIPDGQPVVISAYGHKSWEGALPVGKGITKNVGDEATVEAQFFMDTTHGSDTFKTVQQLSESGLQEWSFSLRQTKARRGDHEGKNVRFVDSTEVKEVSPVLMGAGVNTRTLATKSHRKQLNSEISQALADAGRERFGGDRIYVYPSDFDADAGYVVFSIYSDDDSDRYVQVNFTMNGPEAELSADETEVERVTSFAPKGAKFSEHTDIALRGVKSLIEKACERVERRAAEGKSITEQSEARDQLLAAVEPLTKALDDATHRPTDDITSEFLRFVATSQGVTQ